MDLTVISKNRNMLMGIAILWIMAFHHRFTDIPNVSFWIEKIGYSGVDIFAFCSGFGLYFSLNSGQSVRSFFKKRFWRIIPLTIVEVFLLYGVVNYDNISFLSSESLFYWLAQTWYIEFCFIVYLLFPFFYHSLTKNRTWIWVLIYVLCTVIALLLNVKLYVFWQIWPRFIDVIVGAWIAKIVKENSTPKLTNMKASLFFWGGVISAIALAYLKANFTDKQLHPLGLEYYPSVCFTPILVLFLAITADYFGIIKKIFSFLGTMSLELYFGSYIAAQVLIHYGLFSAASYYAASFILAFFLKKVISDYVVNSLILKQ